MDAARRLDALLATVGVAVEPEQRVLHLGCRTGALTEVLAERAQEVVALDVSAAALDLAEERLMHLDNVTFVLSDGESLDAIEDADVDAAIVPELFRRLDGAKAQLAHVAELGRVLAPGGWAVIALSTDPAAEREAAAPPPAPRQAASRRDMLRLLRPPAPRPKGPPPGPFVPLDALGAVAVQAGLTLERIEGAGTRDTVALARRS